MEQVALSGGQSGSECVEYSDSPEYTEDDINKVLLFRMNNRTSHHVDAENKDGYTIMKIK